MFLSPPPISLCIKGIRPTSAAFRRISESVGCYYMPSRITNGGVGINKFKKFGQFCNTFFWIYTKFTQKEKYTVFCILGYIFKTKTTSKTLSYLVESHTQRAAAYLKSPICLKW